MERKKNTWGFNIHHNDNGFFMIKFDTGADKENVMSEGSWMFLTVLGGVLLELKVHTTSSKNRKKCGMNLIFWFEPRVSQRNFPSYNCNDNGETNQSWYCNIERRKLLPSCHCSITMRLHDLKLLWEVNYLTLTRCEVLIVVLNNHHRFIRPS